MPIVKLFDQEQELQQAMELFWEKGYNATSLTDLTEKLKIGKGSFYDTFEGKRQLFDKAVERYRVANLQMLKQKISSEQDVPAGIKNLLESAMNEAFNDVDRKGCFMANTCSEMGNHDMEIRELLIKHQKEMYDILYTYLKPHNFKSGISTEQATNLLITFMTGMNQEVKIKKDKSQLQQSVNALLILF
jgi:TetR/AcrR family transcriptional repressor of nem operon